MYSYKNSSIPGAPVEVTAIMRNYQDRFQPTNCREEGYVALLAVADWRLRRSVCREAEIVHRIVRLYNSAHHDELSALETYHATYTRRIDTLYRSYHRALAILTRAQSRRRPK